MQKKSAFTLIELIVTLALISILLVLALPSIHHYIMQNRVTGQLHQIMSAIYFARSEAITRGTVVTFCKSENSKNCGGKWREGQLLLAGNEILRVYPALPAGDELRWQSSLGKNEALQWAATGFTLGQKGSFYYCSSNKQYSARIIIEQTGRARIEEGGGC